MFFFLDTWAFDLRAIVLGFPELGPVNLSRALGPYILSNISDLKEWTIHFDEEDAQPTSTRPGGLFVII